MNVFLLGLRQYRLERRERQKLRWERAGAGGGCKIKGKENRIRRRSHTRTRLSSRPTDAETAEAALLSSRERAISEEPTHSPLACGN